MNRRITIILILGVLAGGGLYAFQRYLDNPNSAINRFVPVSWLSKARLASIAAHFPVSPLPHSSALSARPPVDLPGPARTETALFAIG